jgi:hypothetical protein
VHQDRIRVVDFKMHVHIEAPDATEVRDEMDMKCFTFPSSAAAVTLRMATSLISAEQAQLNLHREAPSNIPYERVLEESKQVWRDMLGRVNVMDSGTSCLKSRSLWFLFIICCFAVCVLWVMRCVLDVHSRHLPFFPFLFYLGL